jgi:carboxypeptidase C (cathepsin A)
MQGYYDLATPHFAAEYEINHLGIHPEVHKNISWAYYPAGHMMYIEKGSRKKFKQDMSEFIRGATQEQ